MAMMRRVFLCALCSFVFNNQSHAFESVRQNGVTETGSVNNLQLQRGLYHRNRSDRFMGRGSLVRNGVPAVANINNGVNNSRIEPKGSELTDCKFDAGFITCVKLTLLSKVTGVLQMIQEYEKHNQRFDMLNGLLTLDKVENQTNSSDGNVYQKFIGVSEDEKDGQIKLDKLLSSGITKLFQNRSLSVNFIPGLSFRVLPSSDGSSLLNVSVNFTPTRNNEPHHLVKRDTGIRRTLEHDFMEPWMLIPAAFMVGLFPYMLLKLKILVMQAFGFNKMLLLGAILMTLRNFVFGNRPGGIIQYGNYGYTEKPLPHYSGEDYMGYNMGYFGSTSNFYPQDAGVASEQDPGGSSEGGQGENQVNGHAQPAAVHEEPSEQASYAQPVNVQPPAQESQTLQGVNMAIQAAEQPVHTPQDVQQNQLANVGLVNPYPQLQIIPLGYNPLNPYVNGLAPIVTGELVANQNSDTQRRDPIKRRFSTTRRYPESSTIRYRPKRP